MWYLLIGAKELLVPCCWISCKCSDTMPILSEVTMGQKQLLDQTPEFLDFHSHITDAEFVAKQPRRQFARKESGFRSCFWQIWLGRRDCNFPSRRLKSLVSVAPMHVKLSQIIPLFCHWKRWENYCILLCWWAQISLSFFGLAVKKAKQGQVTRLLSYVGNNEWHMSGNDLNASNCSRQGKYRCYKLYQRLGLAT